MIDTEPLLTKVNCCRYDPFWFDVDFNELSMRLIVLSCSSIEKEQQGLDLMEEAEEPEYDNVGTEAWKINEWWLTRPRTFQVLWP